MSQPLQSYEEICLAALGPNQDAVRQVDHQLREVVKNIHDPNTDATKKRSVTLKIEFKPNQNRQSADITWSVEAKLAGDMPGSDFVTIGKNGTGLISMAEQLELPGPTAVNNRNGGEA